jgi:hypothetical protein
MCALVILDSEEAAFVVDVLSAHKGEEATVEWLPHTNRVTVGVNDRKFCLDPDTGVAEEVEA